MTGNPNRPGPIVGAVSGRHLFTVTRDRQPAHVPGQIGWGYQCACGSTSGAAWLSEIGARVLGFAHAPGAIERPADQHAEQDGGRP